MRRPVDGKIFKRCVVYALADSLQNIVNHLFTELTMMFYTFFEHTNFDITLHETWRNVRKTNKMQM